MPNITWTQSETAFLKSNYNHLDQKLLIQNLQNRSWGSILSKASVLGLTGQYIEWKPQEIEFLKENYQTSTQHYLTTNLQNRKWKSIRRQAFKLGLERISILRKADLSILLEETPTTYYWIGFLMADGSFSDRRLHLGVARKDLNHLKKFLNFVNSSNKISKTRNKHAQNKIHYRVKITCVQVIKALIDKFKISSRKTYEPCSISHIQNSELLFSLIVGFLDGDGCVAKTNGNSHRISFIGHPSWLENFCFMKKFIHNYFAHEDKTNPPKITKRWTTLPQDKTKTKKEYFAASFYISKTSLIEAIRDKAVELKLPFLQRKLGKIN
jgi:hypothetical protein